MTTRQMAGGALIVMGIAAGILWVSGRITNPFAPVGALILLLGGASLFGKTSRFAEKLQPFVGQNVRVLTWGRELPETGGASFKVVKVQALGAGLHFYLRALPEGSAMHLKVAQPLEATINERAIVISHAKYIQWAGKKVKKSEREKALLLSLPEERS